MSITSITPRAVRCAFALMACLPGAAAVGQDMHHLHGAAAAEKPPVFVASTAKSFAALMHDAMDVMDDGMKRAPMNGVSEHDFVTMMIPHHQGAVDMAKGVLLYTRDPELRNLAQGIITEQQNEIRVMQAWLQPYQAAQANVSRTSISKNKE